MSRFPKIGDLVEVPPVQTVIRLEEGRTRSESITKSFVFTSDVASHFSVISDALLKETGRGFFLQGDFGSGKSHFLATLTAWLEDTPGSEVLSRHHGGLSRVKASGRRFLTVDISLIQYRGATPLERIIVEAVEKAFASHGIEIKLTPISAFLNYFATLLENKELATAFAGQAGVSDTAQGVEEFLRKDPRQAYTSGMRFMKSIGMPAPETLVEERHETFARVLRAIRDEGFDGLVIVMDELSEFFRSKPDTRALNEDARTLQFIGELSGREPVWIVGAVQESIERTGDISQVTFQKIKDRFPVKFILSTVHIKALISERLVKKKAGSGDAIHGVYEYFCRQFPSFKWRFEDFQAVYPVHPVCIALLDGLGDLFSEHRGIVDFVYSQLTGDESRQISGILDRPAYELLGPDSIYEHFSRKLAEFSGFNVYPRHVIPHLDEVIEQVVDPEDRMLARRIVRVLVLYRIHPTADIPSVRDLTDQVSCALSDHDPSLNVDFVAQAILDPLVEKSKFLVKHPSETGDAGDVRYEVVTEEDPTKILKARILRVESEISPDDNRLMSSVFAELPESSSWPGPEFMERGVHHAVKWLKSDRRVFVSFLGQGEESSLNDEIQHGFDGGNTDFAVVMSLGKTDFKAKHTAVWEIPISMDQKKTSILREYFAAKQVSSALDPSNPADAPMIETAWEAVEKLSPAAHDAVLSLFYEGRFSDLRMDVEPVIRQMRRFERLLDQAGEILLQERYPGYREIAPRKISPLPMHYQRLINEFIFPGNISLRESHSRGLNDAIEGLAIPLGLVELRAGSYVFIPDHENHPLLSTVFGLISGSGETKLSDVLHSLQTGRFGLPEDTAYFLLAALAFGGLITLLKNGRAMPLEFLKLLKIKNADALAPGEVIGKYDRETLLNECRFLCPDDRWESFGLRQQREAWQSVVKFRDWAVKTVGDTAKRLSAFSEFSAFEAFDLGTLNSRLNALINLCEEIKISYPAREGLERFLKGWRDQGLSFHDIEFIRKIKKFLVRQVEQFVFVNHYVQHTAVERACREDIDIAALKRTVMGMLDYPEDLVTADDPSRLQDAFDRFRTAYAVYYVKKHNEHYTHFAGKPLSRFATRAMVLLKRLAAIEILDRPAGLEGLFHKLEGPKVEMCKRNLSEELMRSPVCNCAFIPGETPTPLKEENHEKIIEKCLKEYLIILKNPKVREVISARIFALADADPDKIKRLKSLLTLLEDERSSVSVLLDLLDYTTAEEISKALAGRVKIEKRGLTDLYSHLGGRRLAPNQVSEIVTQWIGASGENTVIAIQDDRDISPVERTFPLSWWSMMHPALFKEQAGMTIREMEDALERQFPSRNLKHALNRLDDRDLLAFIQNEPFHSNAVRMAWLLLAGRMLYQTPVQVTDDAGHAGITSRHVDPQVSGQITGRLTVLKRMVSLWNDLFPQVLRVRIPLSQMRVDSWCTEELRSLVDQKLQIIAEKGEAWLNMLSPVEPVILKDYPLVLILDGVSPDVWLETMASLRCDMYEPAFSWHRLEAVPKTGPAISSLFGFLDDAMDEFSSRDIPYHHLKGNEIYGLEKLLPPFAPDRAAVIRISLVDDGAHTGVLRLAEMPAVLCRFLENELPRLQNICATQKRRLVLTADHGLSLTGKGLSHGQGGVFERAIFRVEWGTG
jgi:hypothetical protein